MPRGMDFPGSFRSPDIPTPARIPVTAGKNTAKTGQKPSAGGTDAASGVASADGAPPQKSETSDATIAALEAKKTEPREIITADESAYFISYIDGYESELTVDTMASLTPQQLAEINDDGALTTDHKGVIGKLVDGYAWYIVGIFDNTTLRLSEGDRVDIRPDSASDTMRAEVISLASAGNIGETQIIMRCETMTYDTVQHRTERVEIVRKTVEGIKIPRSAIRFMDIEETVVNEDGSQYQTTNRYMGVWVLVGENAAFKKLNIVYETEDFYLSELNAGAD